MKKQFLFVLFLALFCQIQSYAHDAKAGDLFYNLSNDGTARVTYKGKKVPGNNKGTYPKMQAVVIPETITANGRTYTVSGIDSYAFYGNDKLICAVLPKTITYIGDYAFYCCNSLATLTLPDAVTTIGKYAFFSSSLPEIVIPSSVTEIGEYAFAASHVLKSFKLLSNSKNKNFNIPAGLLYKCVNLSSFDTKRNILEFGNDAFYGCEKLEKIIFLSCKYIGERAFKDCKGIQSVIFPRGSLLKIGEKAFQGCSVKGVVYLPKSLAEMGRDVFTDCPSITDIYMSTTTRVAGTKFDGALSVTLISNPVLGSAKIHFYQTTPSRVPYILPIQEPAPSQNEVARLRFSSANITGTKENKRVLVCFYTDATITIYVGQTIDFGFASQKYDFVPSSDRIHLYNNTKDVSLRITPGSVKLSYAKTFFEEFTTLAKEEKESNKQNIDKIVKAFQLKKTDDPEDDDWDDYYYWW